MKTFLKVLVASALAFFAATAAFAQQQRYNQAELDQVLAPVALYPDSLLSQLLMAATYPRELAEAAAWSRANPRMIGEDAVRSVENEPWDPSVKSLVAFPHVLQMMDERRDWTERLGDAFASSPELVSDTVQELRRRADEAGNLRSSDQMKVYRDDRYYTIEPASPEVVYVPYYDPRVAYGRWWWPSYQPIWWGPWSGYSWRSGYGGFGWGYGITLGSGFFYSGWDWPSRHIFFRDTWPRYHRGWDTRHGHRWWHDRNRDGRPDGRWDGRRRDGYRDGRRDGRRGSRDGVTDPVGAPRVAPGAPSAPQYRETAPQYRETAPRVQAAPVGRSAVPGYAQPAPRSQQAPVVSEQQPVARRAPAPAPVARGARADAPAAPAAPVARESRPAPAAREVREQPAARESRSDDSPRSGGRGSGERSRER